MGAVGHGCDHCEMGKPITEVWSRAGTVRLCLECTMLWFPGRDGQWFEERHTSLSKHKKSSRIPLEQMSMF